VLLRQSLSEKRTARGRRRRLPILRDRTCKRPSGRGCGQIGSLQRDPIRATRWQASEDDSSRPLLDSPERGADRSGCAADGPDREPDALDHGGNASNCDPHGSGRGTDGTFPVEDASDRDVDTSDRRPDAPDCDADASGHGPRGYDPDAAGSDRDLSGSGCGPDTSGHDVKASGRDADTSDQDVSGPTAVRTVATPLRTPLTAVRTAPTAM
jgi:hypothetical protein